MLSSFGLFKSSAWNRPKPRAKVYVRCMSQRAAAGTRVDSELDNYEVTMNANDDYKKLEPVAHK
jgi:hypothetical protein